MRLELSTLSVHKLQNTPRFNKEMATIKGKVHLLGSPQTVSKMQTTISWCCEPSSNYIRNMNKPRSEK